jgi:hypothetical protein
MAHLTLNSAGGAGAWLTALPAHRETSEGWDPHLLLTAIKARMKAVLARDDTICSYCGEVMDKWGDHAVTCICNRDRNVKDDAIRQVVKDEAEAAGLQPVAEKAGLLPGRPKFDGVAGKSVEQGSGASKGRRPVDVWLPRGTGGAGNTRDIALDFVVSSGLRQDRLKVAVHDPDDATDAFQSYNKIQGH